MENEINPLYGFATYVNEAKSQKYMEEMRAVFASFIDGSVISRINTEYEKGQNTWGNCLATVLTEMAATANMIHPAVMAEGIKKTFMAALNKKAEEVSVFTKEPSDDDKTRIFKDIASMASAIEGVV